MIKFKVVEFASPAGTGTQAITGVGFQPKAIILIGSSGTGTGYSSGAFFNLGWATSSSDDGQIGQRLDNGASPGGNWAFTYPATTRAYGANSGNATLSSFDSDGFTLNWSNATGVSGLKITALCFGGSTLSAKAGIINPSGTGSLAFTGVGFQPECLFLQHVRGATWGTEDGTRQQSDFGIATGSGQQWSLNTVSNNGASPSSDGSQFYNNKIEP